MVLSNNVFLVDDDRRQSEQIAHALSKHGMGVLRARSTGLVFDALKRCDLAIVSLPAPTENRLAMVAAIRAVSEMPVIAMVDRGFFHDLSGDTGFSVDGYVLLPWRIEELVARITEAGKRDSSAPTSKNLIRVGDVAIDLVKRLVTVNGARVRLTETEYAIIASIARERGRICDRDRLIAQAMECSSGDAAAVLHVHISRIRKKVGRSSLIELASGYRLSGVT